MSTCHINVKPEFVKKISDSLNKYGDSILAVPAIGSISTYGPSKKKPCFKVIFEAIIPEEAIEGREALNDFGVFAVMRLPKKRIKNKYLSEAPEVPDA